MVAYVYLITNLITNKHYIGKTKNKNLRWSQHKSKAKNGGGYYIGSTIRKYGKDNFTFEIIKTCETEDEAYAYETILVNLFQLRNRKYGYNIKEGGAGGNSEYKVCGDLKIYFSEKYMGSKSHRAKFSDKQVFNILTEYSLGGITTRELAKKYKVAATTMIRIIQGESYSNIQFDRSNWKKLEKDNRSRKAPKGLKNPAGKLSDKQVVKIRKLYATGKYKNTEIAKMFKVSAANIGYIVKNKSRKI